jgi:hypothetical protein
MNDHQNNRNNGPRPNQGQGQGQNGPRPQRHHNRPYYKNRNDNRGGGRDNQNPQSSGSGHHEKREGHVNSGEPRNRDNFRRDNRDFRDNRNNNRRPHHHHRSNERQNFNRPEGQGNQSRFDQKSKVLSPTRVLQKYDNLLDQHLVARKKYYEMFGRTEGEQRKKLERVFFKSIEELRNFELGLEDWQKKTLEQKTEMYPKDTFISSTYGEKPIEVAHTGEFEDPHFLPTQRQAHYEGDTEESIGTIEDYKKYKNITD